MNAIKEARYNLGIAYLNDAQYQEAIPELEAVIQLDPDYIDAHCGLSRAYLKLNQLDKAEIATIAALNLNPDYPSALSLSDSIKNTHYDNAITLLNGKQYNEAITKFDKIATLDPKFKDINYYLGHAYLGLKDYEKAVSFLQNSIGANSEYDDIHYLIGNAYVELRQFQNAIQHLENATTANPNHIEAHYDLARAYRGSGNLEAATNAVTETLRLDPNYQPVHDLVESIKQTHYNKGISHLNDERYSDAVVALQNVISLDPTFPAAHYNLGIAYLKMENYPRAIDNLQKTITLDQTNKAAHHGLALAFLGHHELENARNAAKVALSIDPNYQPAKSLLEAIDPTFSVDTTSSSTESQHPNTPEETDAPVVTKPSSQPRHEAHNATGLAYLNADKLDEAISEFKKAIDLNPDYAEAHLNLANAYFQNQQLDESENSAKEVLRIDPNSQSASQLLAKIRQERQKDSEVEPAQTDSTSQEDIDVNKELERGLVYLNTHQYKHAAVAFKKVIKAEPKNIEAHSRLGETYLAWGAYDDANTSAEKALQLNPNHKPSQEIIQMVKYVQKAEHSRKIRKKVLFYASIVVIIGFIGLLVFRFFIDQQPSPPLPPPIISDISLEPNLGSKDKPVYSGKTGRLKVTITNKVGIARNIGVRISPKSKNGLNFTYPTNTVDIGENQKQVVYVNIKAGTKVDFSRESVTIHLVGNSEKILDTKKYTFTVSPLPIISDISLEPNLGRKNKPVFSGKTGRLKVTITNKDGIARNTKVRIIPTSRNGLNFTIPTNTIDIGENKKQVVYVNIKAGTKVNFSKVEVTIRLVDKSEKTLDTEPYTFTVIGPDPGE